MQLEIRRQPSLYAATLGKLFVDGIELCCTLEDEVREVPGQPVSSWKIQARTAIPRGKYEVRITESTRFKRPMPQLMDVPGFAGIRIHSGNTAADTEGCILLGMTEEVNLIYRSKEAFGKFFPLLEAALKDGPVYVTIS